jgi:hypothetical protein
MQDFLTKAITTTQTSAQATLDLHSNLISAGLSFARAGLGLMEQPFNTTAMTNLLQDLFEAQKKALTTWSKTQSDLITQSMQIQKP